MAKPNTVSEIKRLVVQLWDEYAGHNTAIAHIIQTFTELGIPGPHTAGKAKRGRPAGSGKAKAGRPAGRRKRGSYAVTAEQSVINFITSKPDATAKQVNAHWKAEGRRGVANNTLTKLVHAKKIRRTKIKGERGSTYKIA